jgi:hypothetical protein
MSRFALAVILLAASVSTAMADTIKLPAAVDSVLSASFSSGSGDDVTHVVSVLCKMKDGRQRLYVVTKVSAGRFFGMGRLANPDFIDFVIGKTVVPVWE